MSGLTGNFSAQTYRCSRDNQFYRSEIDVCLYRFSHLAGFNRAAI